MRIPVSLFALLLVTGVNCAKVPGTEPDTRLIWYTDTSRRIPKVQFIRRVPVLREVHLFSGNPANENRIPTMAEVRASVEKVVGNSPLVIVDIEDWRTWPWDPRSRTGGGERAVRRTIGRWLVLIKRIRAASPGIKIGLFGTPPLIERRIAYIQPGSRKFAQLQKANDMWRPVADAVDIICPCLYQVNDDIDKWQVWAEAMLSEAQRYGKPVYAYVMPQYFPRRVRPGYQWIPGSSWARQIKLIRKYCDGVIIYSIYDPVLAKRGVRPFSPQLGWWRVMLQQPEAKDVALSDFH